MPSCSWPGVSPELITPPPPLTCLLQTEVSPFVGEQIIYEVSPELHKQLKKAIKKFTAEPAA